MISKLEEVCHVGEVSLHCRSSWLFCWKIVDLEAVLRELLPNQLRTDPRFSSRAGLLPFAFLAKKNPVGVEHRRDEGRQMFLLVGLKALQLRWLDESPFRSSNMALEEG